VTALENSFEGGSDSTSITAGNSGGDSGDAFDSVNASGSLEYDTDITINDSVTGLLTAGTTQSPFVRWDGTSWSQPSEAWARMYFQVSDATPTSNFTIIAFKEANTTTTGCDVRLTTDGKIQLRAPFTTRYESTYTVSGDTPVRLEVHVISHASTGHIEARLFYGANLNGTTPDETFGGTVDEWDTGDGTIGAVNFGCVSTPAQAGFTMSVDGIGLSDADWLGPENYTPPTPPTTEITYVGTGTWDSGTGDLTPNAPAAYTSVASDLAVVSLGVKVADTGEYTTPSGYTKAATILNEVGGVDQRGSAYYKKLTSSEAMPTFTGDTVDIGGAIMSVFRGVDPSTPMDATPVTSEENNQVTWAPDGITTVTDGAFVFVFVTAGHGGTIAFDSGNDQGFTLASTENTFTGTNITMAVAYKKITTAGAVTAPTFEKTSSTGAGQWTGIVLALRPGAAGPAEGAAAQQYIGIYGGGDAPNLDSEPPSSGVSSLLVPDEGAWFGATTPRVNSSGTDAQGLAEWQAEGCRRPQIFPWYKTGAWNGQITAAERAIFDPGGGVPYAIPKYSWKVGNSSGHGTWTAVANGDYDTQIDNCADGIKQFEHTMFFSVYHEPEDNVNSSGNTRAAYRAMWQRVRERFEDRGVDNVVYLLQFAGYAGHAVNGAGSGFEDMYPGDDYIDWLGMDPYTHSPNRNTLDELVNATQGAPTGFTGWYNWAQANHPTKPIMLGEFGAGNTGVQGASTNGVQFTDAQGASVVNDWISALGVTNTAIKAFLYWNGRALGKYDYQIQLSGREQYADAIADLSNDSYFDQDTELARF
jgi:hypothetical protein